MRKSLLGASALIGVALLASSATQAATYIPVVPPAGSISTTVFGINDSNIVAGSYNDTANVEHGFFGPLDGSNYTVFDLGGDVTGTEPRAIGNDGTITGLAKVSGFTFGEEFYRRPDGTTNIISVGVNTFDGVAQGMNGADRFVGDFIDRAGVRAGYIGENGKYLHRIKVPLTVTSTNPRGVNDKGVTAGSYTDTAAIQHGFVKDRDTVTTLDYPGALSTAAEGINNKGVVSGLWTDTAGNRHGFLYDTATHDYTLIDGNDGSAFQQVWGINNHGLVAVNTQQADGTYLSYIYCPHKKANCPQGGAGAEVHAIHVSQGSPLRHDKSGRAGSKPRISTANKRGNIE